MPGHYYYKRLDEHGSAVILFPAIDLKGGACVRLVRGEMASATVFNDDPAAQARAFAEAGSRWLHVVDLDGAFAGRSVNGEAVRAIRRAVDLRIQLGGGIRDRAAIEDWLESRHRRGSCSAPPRCAIPNWCAAPPPIIPARDRRRHRRTRRQGRGRGLGRDQRDPARSIWRGVSRMPGWRRSSTPTSPATAR